MNSHLLIQKVKAFDYLFDTVEANDLQGVITDWNNGSESLYDYTKMKPLVKVTACSMYPKILTA
jgi:hypothetical protein